MSISNSARPFFIYRKKSPATFQLVVKDAKTSELRAAVEVPWSNTATWRLAWYTTYRTTEIKKGYVEAYTHYTPTCLVLIRNDASEYYRVCCPSRWWSKPPRGLMEVTTEISSKAHLTTSSLPSIDGAKTFPLKDLLAITKKPEMPADSVDPTVDPTSPSPPTPAVPITKRYTVADAFNTLSPKNKILAMNKTTDLLWGIEECRMLMDKHGLQEWSLCINTHMICSAGYCTGSRKEIVLSIHMLKATNASQHEKRDVMLHEIAHALVPRPIGDKTEGHGPEWVAKAKEIGCSGERFHHMKFHERLTKPKAKPIPKPKPVVAPVAPVDHEEILRILDYIRRQKQAQAQTQTTIVPSV